MNSLQPIICLIKPSIISKERYFFENEIGCHYLLWSRANIKEGSKRYERQIISNAVHLRRLRNYASDS